MWEKENRMKGPKKEEGDGRRMRMRRTHGKFPFPNIRLLAVASTT
jgi:hypothetical protein